VRLRNPSLALGALALLVAALAGCGQTAGTFSPQGGCLADGRAAGAYPALEALVPKAIGDKPTAVDSGRNCSDAALGTLVSHGEHELQFAGATLDEGSGNGSVIAVFQAATGQPRLTAAWMEEFYTSGAVSSGKTDNTTTTRPTMGAAGKVFRLETLNDLSQQTVVVLPGDGQVRVAIVATAVGPDASKAEHDKRVEAAVASEADIGAPAASIAP
jgi:hypothetical protein